MDTKYKITIPKPCHEDWNKMAPNDSGRFCGSCSKNVVDFTNMLPDEIQVYFRQHSNVCGRFKNSQLDTLTIQIPNRVLYSQTHYRKIFLLALFITMGTTLFSCADKNGNKQKIDKVKIVESSVNTKNEKTNSIKKGKTKPNVKSIRKEVKQKAYSPQTIGELVFLDKDTIKEAFDYNAVFDLSSLETKPYPPEGINKFHQFITENYIAPENTEKFTSQVIISFTIEKDGGLSTFKILRNSGMGVGDEIIRILKTAPKWIPGKLGSQIVASTYTLPISIKESE
jgi:hypothetical protein